MSSRITSSNWYGVYCFNNARVKEYFLELVYSFRQTFLHEIEKWCDLYKNPRVDLMCKIFDYKKFDNDYKKKFNTKLWVLAVSFHVYLEDCALFFSSIRQKYYFYKKIEEIVIEVVRRIKDFIAKKYLCSLGIFFFTILGYKCAGYICDLYSQF